MQFFAPEALLLLWCVAGVAALSWYSSRQRRRRIQLIGDPATVHSKLMADYRPAEFVLRTLCVMFTILFVAISLARPQWGEEKKQVQRKGIDLIFLLDTSLSMLAEDIKPNRLDKAKLEIKNFIRHLKGDRIGMVAFAGSGFLQTPLTLDYAAFLLFLDAVKPGHIPDPGTSLSRAIQLAVKSFPEEAAKHKAMVLFTDGEDHEGGIEQSTKLAQKAGTRIYTIGLGTPTGEPIPLKDEQGRRTGFKKDRQGNIVMTRLNQPLLEGIANDTQALFFPASPSEGEVELILRHMESLGQRQFKERLVVEREDHYQIFLFLALVFLTMEMLVKRSRRPRAAAAIVPVLSLLLFTGFIDSPQGLNKKANELFEEKRYQSALDLYRKAKVKTPENPTLAYNLATALYQLDEFREASRELERAVAGAEESRLRAHALYNYGNTQYRLGNFEKAIEAYEKALEINPQDKDAKYNLEFLQKEKSLFDKKDEQRKKSQQQKQQPQQKQQDNQQEQQDQEQQQQQDQQQEQDEQQEQQQKDQQSQEGEEEGKPQAREQPKQGEQQEQDRDQSQPQQPDEEERPQPQEQGEQQEEQKREKPEEQARPEEEEGQEEEPEPQPGDEAPRGRRAPLQGQMTMDNALRLLEALKESEKELLGDRRPPPQYPLEAGVEKDW